MISALAITFFTSTVSLLVEPTTAGTRALKANFVREMATATSNKKILGVQTSLDSSALRKRVMEKATPLPSGERHLQNYQNANQANANAGGQKDGADDYFVAFGAWNNAFGFDPTQYSLSYHRCAEVRQFDDELAAQEDSLSVFATKHFAVFRFCPSATCNGYPEEDEAELNWWNKTYGKVCLPYLFDVICRYVLLTSLTVDGGERGGRTTAAAGGGSTMEVCVWRRT
jgi:hypothetical protein